MFSCVVGQPHGEPLYAAWQQACQSLPVSIEQFDVLPNAVSAVFGHRSWPRRVYAQSWVQSDLTFIFDGRLNYRQELADKLGFDSRPEYTVAELIGAAYQQWGQDCIQSLYGEFSLTVWDASEQVLWVSNSPTMSGSQPVYWAELPRGLVVSSMLPLVKATPGIDHSLDFAALALLLTAWLPGSATAYKAVKMLSPGYALHWRVGGLPAVRRWWWPNLQASGYTSPEAHAEHMAELFDAAVTEGLTDSGPMAAQISGGLDSTLGASFAARHLQAQDRTLYAWTQVATPGIEAEIDKWVDADEWEWARLVSKKYPNIEHERFHCGSPCLLEMFENQHELIETPVRNSANHQWINGIFSQAQRLGCEAMFVGYMGNFTVSFDMNRQQLAWHLLRSGQLISAVSLIWGGGWKEPARLARYLLKGGEWGVTQQIRKNFSELGRLQGLAYREDMQALLERELEVIAATSGADRRTQHVMVGNAFSADARYLSGVETRDPTADRKLVEALLCLPERAHVYKSYGRAQARLMGKNVVPDGIRWRTRRGRQAAEQAGYFALYPERYREAWEQVSRSGLPDVLGRDGLNTMAETVLSGKATLMQAATFFRVLDVGLFVQRSGQSWPDRLAVDS